MHVAVVTSSRVEIESRFQFSFHETKKKSKQSQSVEQPVPFFLSFYKHDTATSDAMKYYKKCNNNNMQVFIGTATILLPLLSTRVLEVLSTLHFYDKKRKDGRRMVEK